MGDPPPTVDQPTVDQPTADPPTADVYAGDTTSLNPPTGNPTRHFLFVVEADCEPHVLARVAGILNIANAAPHSVNLTRRSSNELTISVVMEIGQATAESIRRKLEQLTCVMSVVLNETESADHASRS
jgi:hypothetical protein